VPIFHAASIAILPSLSVASLRMCSGLCHFYPRVEFNYSVRRGGLQTQNAHIGDLTYRHQHHLHTGFLERRSIIASIILSSITCDAAGITDRVHLAAKIRLSIHHSLRRFTKYFAYTIAEHDPLIYVRSAVAILRC
jgi:hypothetical protein